MWANSRLLLKYKCQAACFIEDVHQGQFSAALIPGFPAVCGTAYVPFFFFWVLACLVLLFHLHYSA